MKQTILLVKLFRSSAVSCLHLVTTSSKVFCTKSAAWESERSATLQKTSTGCSKWLLSEPHFDTGTAPDADSHHHPHRIASVCIHWLKANHELSSHWL